jgi:hypothetical protein
MMVLKVPSFHRQRTRSKAHLDVLDWISLADRNNLVVDGSLISTILPGEF